MQNCHMFCIFQAEWPIKKVDILYGLTLLDDPIGHILIDKGDLRVISLATGSYASCKSSRKILSIA